MVPGRSAIGRVAAVGPDATTLKPGQLVFFDSYIHSRDDPSVGILSGITHAGHPGGKILMEGEWRNSSYAQFLKAPLENVHALDEIRLCGSVDEGGLGLTVEQILWLPMGKFPFGPKFLRPFHWCLEILLVLEISGEPCLPLFHRHMRGKRLLTLNLPRPCSLRRAACDRPTARRDGAHCASHWRLRRRRCIGSASDGGTSNRYGP